MREIRIRQMRYLDARDKLEREIHEAFMNGETRIQVLHGIGTGQLRQMTVEFIESLSFAEVADSPGGNPGVTLVNLYPPAPRYLKRWKK